MQQDTVRGRPAGRVTFTAEMFIDPARVEEFRAAIEISLRRARQEPECVLAYVQESVDEPGRFLLFEQWTDGDRFFDVIREKDYFVEYRRVTLPMHVRERVLTFWEPLEPDGVAA